MRVMVAQSTHLSFVMLTELEWVVTLLRTPFMHLLLLLASVGAAGCATFGESFSDDIDRTYNPWLGATKEDRIHMIGPPDRCTRLQSQEEVCAWDRMALNMPGVRRLRVQNIPSWMHHVVYVYDQTGVARSWHYSGTWGERSSGDREPSAPPQRGTLLP